MRNFNVYKKKNGPDQIWLCETLDDRLRWYTKLRVKRSNWDKGLKASINSQLKAELDNIDSIYSEIKRQLDKRNILTAYNAKYLLDCESIWKAENYIDEIIECIKFIPPKEDFKECFKKFIEASEDGSRKTEKGKKLSNGSIRKYYVTQNLLNDFCKDTGYILEWKNINYQFYEKLTHYCWYTRNHFDNHVTVQIENIISCINWCVKIGVLKNKLHDKRWVKWRETEVDILVLYPSEIPLLYQMPIENKQTEMARDNFIFGCLTCLRSGNLLSLNESDLEIIGNSWFINPVQIKVDKKVIIKVPNIGIEIIKKYRGKFNTLLPEMDYITYNKELKNVAKLFKAHLKTIKTDDLLLNDWNKQFTRIRYRQGEHIKVQVEITDVLTPHCERSTGITSLLIAGMREFEVKKISGHTKDSNSFGRYVRIAQKFIDAQSEAAWNKIFNKEQLLVS